MLLAGKSLVGMQLDDFPEYHLPAGRAERWEQARIRRKEGDWLVWSVSFNCIRVLRSWWIKLPRKAIWRVIFSTDWTTLITTLYYGSDRCSLSTCDHRRIWAAVRQRLTFQSQYTITVQ